MCRDYVIQPTEARSQPGIYMNLGPIGEELTGEYGGYVGSALALSSRYNARSAA